MVPTALKLVDVTRPAAAVNGASATTTYIDTLGYKYCRVIAYIGTTDVALTALKVQESDSSGSGYADVTGLVLGTSTNSAGSTSSLPTALDDGKFFVFNIDLRGRKRYLDVTATADSSSGSTGCYMAIWAELWKGETAPSAAAGYGAEQVLQVPAFA